MEMWMVWAAIGVVLVVAEMMTLTFYLLWLGAGAFTAAIVSWLMPEGYFLQVLIGGIVVVVLTVFTRPLTRNIRQSRGYKDVVDELIGKQGEVVQNIGEHSLGVVRIGSETWSASAKEAIGLGEQVIVVARSSTVVEVEKMGGM
jgi:inner membrane protein